MSNYAGRKMMVDVRIKKYILDFIHRADYNITDVSVEKKVEPIPADFRDFLMNDETFERGQEEVQAVGHAASPDRSLHHAL